MKKIITIAILLLPALFACGPDSKDGDSIVTSVVLSRDKVDLHVGESTTITATVLPASLGMGVVWSILDEEYAEVKDGTITAKAEGVTYAVATSADGSQKAACMVSVNPMIQYTTSIRNESGQVLNGIYAYPGKKIKLSAETSDGGIHSFTWSLEDTTVGTITADGQLTLAANASTAAGFVYDAESYLKVTTEAGYGCKIPVRSSLLNGLKLGDVFNPAGTPIIVQASDTYPIGIMYQGHDGPLAIPADDINVSVSNSAFQVQKAEGAYTLATGPTTGVSTKLNVSFPGSSESIEIAELKIDKVYGITAQFAAASSSTLSFTWTEGVSSEDDVAKPYTIYLYKDEECTDLEASFSIPAGDGCWKGRQPKFIFSGLTPATTYWFKVDDTTSGAE
nr:Ig-like domain-containing protein [Bacteroidales bacterium]